MFYIYAVKSPLRAVLADYGPPMAYYGPPFIHGVLTGFVGIIIGCFGPSICCKKSTKMTNKEANKIKNLKDVFLDDFEDKP